MPSLQVGLIGERDEGVVAHRAIPLALQMAAEACGVVVEPVWVPTDQVGDGAALVQFGALWCVPASPYRSMEGALTAIAPRASGEFRFLALAGASSMP